jgi:PAS domain S-box-containing protein
MCIFDLETLEILSVNSTAIEKLGYSRDELLAMRVTDIHPIAAAPQSVKPVEITICRKDGSVLEFERIWIPTSFAGRRSRLVAALDVTERNRAERELADRENLLRRIFDAEPECVKLLDEDGRLLDMNPAGVQMVEVESINEVRHRPIYPFIVPEHRGQFREAVRRIFRGEPSSLQFEIVGNKGTRRWMDMRAVPLRDAAGQITALLAITRDVSKARELEELFRQSQKMEAVGRLAGGIAHDFNNILTIIGGYAGLTLDLPDIGEIVRRHLTSIHNGVLRASALTRQLLAFSRNQLLQPRVLDLNALITTLSSLIARVIGEDAELTLRLGSEVGNIKADPGKIEQVIMNLVVNARDAMPRGGTLHIETGNFEFISPIEVGSFHIKPGHYVTLTVSDSGMGMNKEVLSRIFEPFFTTKEQGRGTGLGLSTVYGIVQQSGGAITVHSSPDQGARFAVYYPMAKEPVKPQPVIPSRATGGKERIMVVEDDPELRELIQGMLMSYGYSVVTAESGAVGLQLLEQRVGVDLILTDVVMPGMSGLALGQHVQQRGLPIKVVYMSGYNDDFIAQPGSTGVPAGVHFIEKPFTQESLSLTVRQVLDA